MHVSMRKITERKGKRKILQMVHFPARQNRWPNFQPFSESSQINDIENTHAYKDHYMQFLLTQKNTVAWQKTTHHSLPRVQCV